MSCNVVVYNTSRGCVTIETVTALAEMCRSDYVCCNLQVMAPQVMAGASVLLM